VQTPGPPPVVDRVGTEADRAELPACDDAVLSARKLRHVDVEVRSTFPAYAPGFVDRVRHGGIVARKL
jgi:hypothetical protein